MPVGLPVLFRHGAVPGVQRHNQHPAAGTAGQRERDGDVSMKRHLLRVLEGIVQVASCSRFSLRLICLNGLSRRVLVEITPVSNF